MIPTGREFTIEQHPFSRPTLAETLIGGQAFRWFWLPEAGCWCGSWADHAVRLHLDDSGQLRAAFLTAHTTVKDVVDYLGFDRLPKWISRLPCASDPVLAELRNRWGGLSLLRQPAGETLLAFICSSNKQILQIRQMLQALSRRFGRPIPGSPFHTLPTWEELADIPETEFRACALGYRAAHIAKTARFLREHAGYLQRVTELPYPEARVALRALPGVGPKVADCVLLFGFGRAEAFPVDTWIARLLEERYPALNGWPREQLATFARIHFGAAAGLAQQWFFADRLSQKAKQMPQTGVIDERFWLLQ